jgi:transcriptional regulator with XRE-family HTH domain
VGVSPQSASRWLNGRLTQPPARLHAIAEALGVSEEELWGRRKADMESDMPGDLPESVQGQIDAIDTQILLLRHNKRALLGKGDVKRHKEGVRIIRELLKTELSEK